jgi:hypothetical protein
MTDFHPLRRLLVLLLSLFCATMGSAAALAERSDFDRCAIAAKTTATGAESALQGAQLNRHLTQLEKYGAAGSRTLENGRVRYYGNVDPARTPGEMAGRRLVREWDPSTNATRTWHETVDHAGSVRQVRPETGGPKVHYRFDANGNYIGSW